MSAPSKTALQQLLRNARWLWEGINFAANDAHDYGCSPHPYEAQLPSVNRRIASLERELTIIETTGDYEERWHERVQRRAYALWEQRGRPLGDSDHDWFAAETLLWHEITEGTP